MGASIGRKILEPWTFWIFWTFAGVYLVVCFPGNFFGNSNLNVWSKGKHPLYKSLSYVAELAEGLSELFDWRRVTIFLSCKRKRNLFAWEYMESSESETNPNFAGEPERQWSCLHKPKFVCFRYIIFFNKLKTKEEALLNVKY